MCYDSNIYYQSVSKEEISSEARVSNGSCFFRDFTMINEARKMNEAIDAIMRNELKDVFDNVDYIRNMDEN